MAIDFGPLWRPRVSAEAFRPAGLRLRQSIEVVCPRFMTFSGRSGINFRSVRPVEVGIAATRGCAVRVRTTCVCARLLRLVVPHHKLPLLSSRAGRYVCAVCVPRNAQFLRVRNGDDDKLREIHRRGLSCSGWVSQGGISGFGPKMEDFNGEFLNGARANGRIENGPISDRVGGRSKSLARCSRAFRR